MSKTKLSCLTCGRSLKTCTLCVTYRAGEVNLLQWKQEHPEKAAKDAPHKVPTPSAETTCAACNGRVGADGTCADCGNVAYRHD